MEGENRDIQELLTALEAAFVARSQDEDTGSDDKLLGLLKQLIHEYPDGFFLMQGDKLAFSHRRLEQFQRTGKQEDFPMFDEDLSDRELERLHAIQQRVTAAIFQP